MTIKIILVTGYDSYFIINWFKVNIWESEQKVYEDKLVERFHNVCSSQTSTAPTRIEPLSPKS
jgi:hypothetical protein